MENEAATISYGALALLPAILAIALAIWKRQVIVSLLFGIFVGATIINGYNPLKGLIETFSTFIVQKSLADSWNIGILTFCMAIGGMIGIIGKMGGTRAIADSLIKKATGVRSTMLATAIMGIAIFFDDYANSMIVGNTMRPITDKQRISREKLSYIIDSTAAPVSSMAPLSTWIAMELGLIASGLETANIEANSMLVFFQTIPFRFYSLFAVILVFFLIFQRKDYGPMLKAEIRARKTGAVYASDSEPLVADDPDLEPATGITYSISDAVIPILIFVLVTIIGLWYNGGGMEEGKTIKDAYGDADASIVLTWAAFIGSIVAGSLALLKGKLSLKATVDSWVSGTKSMINAVIILALAFALKAVIGDMDLAGWLISNTEGILSGSLLPLITFLVACIIAFATGTSWGTNSILMPIVIPIAASLSTSPGEVTSIMTATMGAVLTGAVFGDHCSPISDTTILSSMASGSDHTDHVRTQIPYAITAALLAIILGFIPVGLGLPAWISLLVGIAALWLIVMLLGKRIDERGDIIAQHLSFLFKLISNKNGRVNRPPIPQTRRPAAGFSNPVCRLTFRYFQKYSPSHTFRIYIPLLINIFRFNFSDLLQKNFVTTTRFMHPSLKRRRIIIFLGRYRNFRAQIIKKYRQFKSELHIFAKIVAAPSIIKTTGSKEFYDRFRPNMEFFVQNSENFNDILQTLAKSAFVAEN